MLVRYVPLNDEAHIRPEDKPLSVVGISCLCGYWGRILLNSLSSPGWILVANFGVSFIEAANRLTVVSRDKSYLNMWFLSKNKGENYWTENAPGMKRFRCSMIYTKFCTEYLMIFSAAGFYWWASFPKDKDKGAFVFNVAIQFFFEIGTDSFCAYFEFFRARLPILQAWRNRQPRWLIMFGAFLIAFQCVAVSLSAENYCALRRKGSTDSVQMTFCPT